MTDKLVRVGMGVFVFHKGKFAMLKRQGAHGEGTWSVPGGHIEYSESFEQTAKREVKEELAIEITDVRFGAVTNDYFAEEDKHYVTVWMLANWHSGTIINNEPDKSTAVGWFTFDSLPHPLFLPWQQLLDSTFITDIKQQARNT